MHIPAVQEENGAIAEVDHPGRDRPDVRRDEVAGAQSLSVLEERDLAGTYFVIPAETLFPFASQLLDGVEHAGAVGKELA
jgi:hypothetical protein